MIGRGRRPQSMKTRLAWILASVLAVSAASSRDLTIRAARSGAVQKVWRLGAGPAVHGPDGVALFAGAWPGRAGGRCGDDGAVPCARACIASGCGRATGWRRGKRRALRADSKLLVDGKPLRATFGTEGAEWHWQDGGTVKVGREATVALHDLTGFEGRCDAVLFCRRPGFPAAERPGGAGGFPPAGIGSAGTAARGRQLRSGGGGRRHRRDLRGDCCRAARA